MRFDRARALAGLFWIPSAVFLSSCGSAGSIESRMRSVPLSDPARALSFHGRELERHAAAPRTPVPDDPPAAPAAPAAAAAGSRPPHDPGPSGEPSRLVVEATRLDESPPESERSPDAAPAGPPGPRASPLETMDDSSLARTLVEAARLAAIGDRGGAERVLASILQAPEPPGEPAGAAFRIVGAAFADAIHGPGDYTARARSWFRPGESLLVYGELAGFREDAGASEDGLEYSSHFSASLELATDERGPEGLEPLDRLEFLKPDAGLSRSKAPRTFVNFWARFTLPHALAPGRYELRVIARDHLSEAEAETVLAVRVRARSAGDEGHESGEDTGPLPAIDPHAPLRHAVPPVVEKKRTVDSP